MTTFKLSILFFFLSLSLSFSQENLEKLLSKYNSHSIPYISVEELKMIENEVIILDSRELKEYNVSHLKNAIFIGYNDFDIRRLQSINNYKNKPIVVYCSLGIRSENISEKLKDAGISDVRNLYGGIFEWKNKGYSVFDNKGNTTNRVHTFSKQWAKWLYNADKIY